MFEKCLVLDLVAAGLESECRAGYAKLGVRNKSENYETIY